MSAPMTMEDFEKWRSEVLAQILARLEAQEQQNAKWQEAYQRSEAELAEERRKNRAEDIERGNARFLASVAATILGGAFGGDQQYARTANEVDAKKAVALARHVLDAAGVKP